LIGAAIALAAFVVIELRSRVPMVDFKFFRSRSFLGANLVAFVVTFSMLAMFFFLALYMQNVLGYTPLEAGVRFLPATVVIIFMGPISGRLSDRIGPRPLMVVGLVMASGALFWQSFVTVHTSFAFLAPAFALMGLGMGLIMSPMTTAGMNAVDRTKAGVASGVLSMSRMVGGTFGVAVLGALVTAVGRSKLDQLLPALPSGKRQALADALGSGGVPGASGQVADAVREAFVAALRDGLRVGAAVALLGAVLAFALIQRNPTTADDNADVRVEVATATPAADPAEAELVAGRA
jgi:MFS family permease